MSADAEESYRVVLAPFDSDLFKEAAAIRVEVFVDEQGYKRDEEFDHYDKTCIHLLLLNQNDEAAGTLRYFAPPKSKIGRVAIRKRFRGKGLGSNLMNGLEALLLGRLEESSNEAIRDIRATELQCNAQVPVVPFYIGLGYETFGEEFLEDGTPHILMKKSIASRPEA